MSPEEKDARYAEAAQNIAAVLAGEPDPVARMATIACLLSQALPYYFWTGFYRVDPEKPDELVIGPYQGTLGCLRIAFGRGVCGAAALSGKTQIIADVHAFPDHIACDSRSRSEIVVPVRDARGRLIAVFDVDSLDLGSFDERDADWLARILEASFSVPASAPVEAG